MPMDGLTLGFIARELKEALVGGRVDKVSQPERDEIVMLVRNHNRNMQLFLTANASSARAHLTALKKNNPLEPPMLCMLLRKHLLGGRVADVRQVMGDRILEIDFENLSELGDPSVKTMVCEFMGKHSNLILTDASGRIIECARRVTDDISRVREVLPGLAYVRPPKQDKLPYDAADARALAEKLEGAGGAVQKALAQALTGLSAQTARELAMRICGNEDARMGDMPADIIAERAAAFLSALPGQKAPRVFFAPDGATLDVTAFPYKVYEALPARAFDTLSEAMDAYYEGRDREGRIVQKSAALRRVLRNNVERCEKKLALQLEALAGSERMEEYRVKGELLTAGGAQAKKGMKKALLTNYYDPECALIEVELDEKLSPAQNAQRYFKLYQKARSAKALAAEQKEKTEEELAYFEGQLFNLEQCQSEAELNEIREELEKLGYVNQNHNRRQLKKLPPSQPGHFLSSAGVDILVGRNNLQNDKLTQTAGANETWLHAKDMPGSHVIIVSDRPDEQTLYEAALLAAKHSKGASSSRVPVDYALRKYVKKPSGAKPGFVIYTHQHTLYVTPDEQNMAGIRPAQT